MRSRGNPLRPAHQAAALRPPPLTPALGPRGSGAFLDLAPERTLAPVNPTGCPRCAEKQATTLSVDRYYALSDVVLFCATGSIGVWLSADTLPWWGLLPALVFCWLSKMAFKRGSRLTLRPLAPLPPPPANPLATYRDGPPAECPWHPFAR